MSAFATASRSIFGWVSAAVAVAVIAVSASILAAPGKAYADTASHIEATGEIHALVDGAGNASIPNVILKNTGSVAAYVAGCSAPDELSGWTCDVVGKRIEPGQSVQASWSGQVSADTAAKLGSEAYFAGTLTYSYVDAELKATVAIDNQDPYVGDTVTASVSGLNAPEDRVTYQWYRVKNGVETAIDGAVQPTYTVVDADAGCTLVCKLLSSDSICIGSVSSDATHEVKSLEAFAVYSGDDQSLNFYKRSSVPAAGEQFEGKTATAVYTGIEDTNFTIKCVAGNRPGGWVDSTSWAKYKPSIKTVTVIDEGIQPKSTVNWFAQAPFTTSALENCSLSKINCTSLASSAGMFRDCRFLTSLDLSGWDTSSVTDMNTMFYGCSSLTSLDLSGWDTSSVTDMNTMFYGCSSLTSLDLSNWNTSNVTNMSSMFYGCTKLQEVTFGANWKWVETNGYLPTPDSTYISGADGKWYDTDGNGYAPADIPSNKAMTYYASKDLVPGITISGNAEVGETLTATVNNLSEEEITGYQWYTVDDSSNETAIANATAHTYTVTANEVGKKILCKAFYKNGSATKNVKTTPTDNVTPQKTAYAVYSADDNSLNFYKRTSVPSAGEQFNGKTATAVYTGIENKAYSPWWSSYTSKIKTATVVDDGLQPFNMRSWFYGCKSMTACNLDKLDTSNVTDMGFLFNGCSSLTSLGDLSGWNTSNVTNMKYMFNGCSSLTTTDLSGWNTSNVADMEYMFVGCKSLTSLGDLSGWNTGNVTNMYSMFSSCSSLTTLGDLSNWDTSNVTDMQAAFAGCKSLTTLDLSNWNTSNVTDMSFMFSGCSKLTSTDLSGWNTSNVADMESMFRSCSILVSVNGPSYWNTSNVADMKYMFYDCPKLTTIGDLSGWDTGNVTNMDSMFYRGSSLTTLGDLSNWNTSKVTNMLSMFASCSSLTTIGDLSNWDTSNVTNMNSMFTFCSNLTSLDLSGWDTSKAEIMTGMFNGCSSLTSLGDLSNWNTGNVTYMNSMFGDCSKLSVNCSNWDVSKVTGHSNFNENATGVTVPLAWQASSDEGVEDSAIAPLCEEQGHGKALSVSGGSGNDKTASKTDGEASADSETEGSNTASATDEAGAKEEEASGDIANDNVATV